MRRLTVIFTLIVAWPLFLKGAPADTIAVSRSLEVKRSVAGAGVAIVANAALTELLKSSVNEMRPDRSDNSSFPSRHASYAFTLASVASHELARFSPVWVPLSQTVANLIGMQRVYTARHFPSDVLAGAALGTLSGELGYAVSRLIFGSAPRRSYAADNLSDLSASTVALIPLAGRPASGLGTGCGIESALRLSLPAGDMWGLGASLRLRDLPVYRDAVYDAMLKSFAVTADAYLTTPVFDSAWAVDGRLALGVIRNFSRPSGVAPSVSALADVSAGLYRQLCRRLSIGCRLGCDYTKRPGPDAALSVALVTKAQF